jgi:hypothetical protein
MTVSVEGTLEVLTNNVQFEVGRYGHKAVLTSAWNDDTREVLLRNNVVELELVDAKGWRGNDVSFLELLPRLESFKIIDLTISSDAPIHFLHELKTLEVITYCPTPIEFSAFPKLEDCGLEWRPKSQSLFDCRTLKRLFINNYDGRDSNVFSRLTNLESLAILNAPIDDVRGLGPLRKLKSLRLANLKKLSSLEGLEHLPELEELEIHTCRAIGSVDALADLTNLRVLNLNNLGNIESFRPLVNMHKLESLTFYESTNVMDGDLSVIPRNNLRNISFQNRRHYTDQREDFGSAYSGRAYVRQGPS